MSGPSGAAGAWLPTAPCTPGGCAAGDGRPAGVLRAAGRVAAGCAVTAAGIALAPAAALLGRAARHRLTRAWARAVLRAFGVRVRIVAEGGPGAGVPPRAASGLGGGPGPAVSRGRTGPWAPGPPRRPAAGRPGGQAPPPSAGRTPVPRLAPPSVQAPPPPVGGGRPGAGVPPRAAAGPGGVPGPAVSRGRTGPWAPGPPGAGAPLLVGGPPEPRVEAAAGCLVVSNHVSWLDIPLIAAVLPGRMLAKAEVRRWPVLGAVAARGGTLFVERDRLRALPGTVAQLAAVLRRGARVIVFPEGSTWCGRAQGRFRPAAFQAALDAGVPVQPVRLAYTPTGAAAFVGDDPLAVSLWRVARAGRLTAEIRLLPPIPAPCRADRRSLARTAQLAVASESANRPSRSVHQCANSSPAAASSSHTRS